MGPLEAIEQLKKEGPNITDDMEYQGACLMWSFTKGIMRPHHRACFSYISEVTDRENTPYLGFYVKEPIIREDRYLRWISFVMDYYTELTRGKIFESSKSDLPWILINTNHQYNVVMSCLTSLRMVYEQHFLVDLWNRLVEQGVDEVTAWIFTHLCDATPNDDGRFWLWMKPDREYSFFVPARCSIFHTSLHTHNFSHDVVHNMYRRKYCVGRTKPFSKSSGGVSEVHNMFGSGHGAALELFMEHMAGTKGKSNNPFAKKEATQSKKLSVEDTVKTFLNFVEVFEKEFKPNV